MTPEKLARLAELQDIERANQLIPAWREELDALRRELAASPEVADDPTTLADESRRPLLSGGDYLEQQRQRDCDEAVAWALKLAARIGKEAAEAALNAGLAALRR